MTIFGCVTVHVFIINQTNSLAEETSLKMLHNQPNHLYEVTLVILFIDHLIPISQIEPKIRNIKVNYRSKKETREQ